jgi:hypothetical protein
VIEGVESKCQFASVDAEASLTALRALAGFALTRNETHLACCTGHLPESGELEASEAALRRNRLGSLGCTGEMACHTHQHLVSCYNKDVM